jgi:hypothetical protein
MNEPIGPGLDDEGLGRMLAEGLGRAAAGPVDERELLAGARRGAARIHRRRRATLVAATVLVLGAPGGLVAGQMFRASTSSERPTLSAGSAESSVPGPASMGGDSPLTRQQAPPDAASRPALPSVTARVSVPDTALLTAADLPGITMRRTSDTLDGPVPAAEAADTCGSVLVTELSEIGGRAVVFEQRGDVTPSGWLLGSTVRVYSSGGAGSYLAAARRLVCLSPVVVAGADEALVGQGRPDVQGRVHRFAVVRVGRVVSEVRLTVPLGATGADRDMLRLVRLAGQRLTSSGLAAATSSGLQH